MTEALIWRDAWLMDIDLLDAEHREMVRLINRLASPDDDAPLAGRLGALIDHLRRHFHAEQEFLRAIDYPEIDEHCREHAMQLAEFVDLSRTLAGDGARRVLNEEDMQAIKLWFFNHVIAQDRRFAAFYHEVVCGQ